MSVDVGRRAFGVERDEINRRADVARGEIRAVRAMIEKTAQEFRPAAGGIRPASCASAATVASFSPAAPASRNRPALSSKSAACANRLWVTTIWQMSPP